MIKKRLSLLLIILFCAVLHPSRESFAPDAEEETLPAPLVKSPFIRDSAAFPSKFGIQSLGKYTHDLSPYERKEFLKIAALFSTIEAVSAGVSCVKNKDNYLLTGLFAFRVLRALSHLHLTYQAVKNFDPNEERENPDTEESKKEAASAQYEVAWKVAGTVADSPLFERIRQESYNFTNQPRGGLERFKPLLPVAYPLASGLIGAAFDIVKICQAFRNEPLFMDYKDTEHLMLEFGSLLAHTYASGNIIEMLPTSIKKYALAKGLTATYYPSLVIVVALLARGIITTHGKEYEMYCSLQRTMLKLGQNLPAKWEGASDKDIQKFNRVLETTFQPIESDKRVTFGKPEDAPKCMHCQERVTDGDEILVNKNNPTKVMHVRGHVHGHPHCCFVEKLATAPDSCAWLPKYWVLQEPTAKPVFETADYVDFIYRMNESAPQFEKAYGRASTPEEIEAAITATQKARSYRNLSGKDKDTLDAKMDCTICSESCADCSQDFLVSGETKSAYHVNCLSKWFSTQRSPIDPATRTDVRTNWKHWYLFSEKKADAPARRRTSAAGSGQVPGADAANITADTPSGSTTGRAARARRNRNGGGLNGSYPSTESLSPSRTGAPRVTRIET